MAKWLRVILKFRKGVWGLGFGVWGLGFGVWGLGFGVWGVSVDLRKPPAPMMVDELIRSETPERSVAALEVGFEPALQQRRDCADGLGDPPPVGIPASMTASQSGNLQRFRSA